MGKSKKEIESMRQNESNLTMTTDVAVTTNTTNMEEKGMKGFFKNMKKKVLPAMAGSVTGAILMTSTCFAATDTSAVTQPLDNLKTLVIAVIGAVGVIILAKNVMEFAQAYQQQDSSTMNSALTLPLPLRERTLKRQRHSLQHWKPPFTRHLMSLEQRLFLLPVIRDLRFSMIFTI